MALQGNSLWLFVLCPKISIIPACAGMMGWIGEFGSNLFRKGALSSLLFIGAILSATPSYADDIVTADKSISGDEIALQDGRVLRLTGIKAVGADAQAFLDAALAGHILVLQDVETDRYGRVAASATVQGEKQSLEDALLRAGLAFVYPAAGDDHLDAWCASERDARLAKRGFWSNPFDVAAGDAAKLYGKYGFIVGTVTKAERIKNKVYLNFGADPRTSLTVTIAAHNLRAFKKQGLDPLSLSGKTLRVRGWVTHASGPALTLTDTHQVEVVD